MLRTEALGCGPGVSKSSAQLGMDDVRCILAVFLAVALCFAGTAMAPAWADVAKGGELAQRWCTGCHLVGSRQSGPIQQGPPSFRMVAESGVTAAQLRAFLSHPHGAMPDLALSRAEIDDLIQYILSQRQATGSAHSPH
jgi:mono/diheme cytochrome c family protein